MRGPREEASIPTADGFQCPVGPNGTGEGYYIARGYRPNGHLGDDWNGTKGGDTDLGDPVYATAVGIVTFAKNYHVGWGNVVIIRHAFYEGMTLKYADSLYGHLNDFNVREGQEVKRGQLIGHIGNNFGICRRASPFRDPEEHQYRHVSQQLPARRQQLLRAEQIPRLPRDLSAWRQDRAGADQ